MVSATLIIFLVCIAVLAVFCLWANESWYRSCQNMNYEWFKRLKELTDSVGEALDQMQKEIDELEAKLEDDGR